MTIRRREIDYLFPVIKFPPLYILLKQFSYFFIKIFYLRVTLVNAVIAAYEEECRQTLHVIR